MLRRLDAIVDWYGLPRHDNGAGGELWLSLFLIEVRSVSRNASLTIAFLGNLLLVPFFLYLMYFRNGSKDPVMILWGTALLVSIPAINYATYCIGKDGYYLQGYLTRLTVRMYVRWKLTFLRVYALLFWLCLLPLVLRSGAFAIMAYCAFAVYYAGFGGLLMLFVSTCGGSKIDLRGSMFFASQQFPLYALFFVMPVTTPLIFVDGATLWALGATFGVGVAGLLLTDSLSELIARNLSRRKHRILDL